MSNKVKDRHIKNRTYYFFNNIFNIKNPNNIKIDEKSKQNNSYLLHSISTDQRFETCKT